MDNAVKARAITRIMTTDKEMLSTKGCLLLVSEILSGAAQDFTRVCWQMAKTPNDRIAQVHKQALDHVQLAEVTRKEMKFDESI